MDTSEQYIKMNDCPEIQGEKPEGGNQLSCWITKDLHISKYGDYWSDKKRLVWLPRQDQIQEMLYSPLGIYATSAMFEEIAVFGMSTWKENLPTMEKDQEITSGEQLWLAFYMWEKHEKVWDGNEWLKKQ